MRRDLIKRRKLICLSILVVFVAMLPMIMQHLRARLHLTTPLPISSSIPAKPHPSQNPEIAPANAKTPPKIDYEYLLRQLPE